MFFHPITQSMFFLPLTQTLGHVIPPDRTPTWGAFFLPLTQTVGYVLPPTDPDYGACSSSC